MRVLAAWLAILLLPGVAAAQVKLDTTVATLLVDPWTGTTGAAVQVTLADIEPATITLRLTPLMSGDAAAIVRCGTVHSDEVTLDSKTLGCTTKATCLVPFTIEGAGKKGQYQGTVTTVNQTAVLAKQLIAAMRVAPALSPAIASDSLKSGRLEVDATTQPEFLVTVRNPAGAPPQKFALIGWAGIDAVLPGGAAPAPNASGCSLLSFGPDHFQLEPDTA